MKKELLDNIKVVPAINPQALAASAYGVTIDRLNFLSAVANVNVGAATGSPSAQSVTALIYHGDESDGSDKDEYQPEDVDLETAAVTADDSNASVQIDLAGAKRYITVQFVVAFTGGSTPGIPVGATLVLGDPNYSGDIS